MDEAKQVIALIDTTPTGGGDVPPFNTTIMITIKKATKQQAEENAKKMKSARERMKERIQKNNN